MMLCFIHLLYFCLCCFPCLVAEYSDKFFVKVIAYVHKDGAIWIKEDRTGRFSEKNVLVEAIFVRQANAIGWDYLKISSVIPCAFDDATVAYAAGLVESKLTRIEESRRIPGAADPVMRDAKFRTFMNAFLQRQTDYAFRRALYSRHKSPFWNQVYLGFVQMAGYRDSERHRDRYEIPKNYEIKYSIGKQYYMLTRAEIMDLTILYKNYKQNGNNSDSEIPTYTDEPPYGPHSVGNGVAVLALHNNGTCNFIAGHTKYGPYNDMVRISKKYNLLFKPVDHDERQKRTKFIHAASAPGQMYSSDVFLSSQSRVLQMGTFLNSFDARVFKSATPNSIPFWLRSVASLRVAENAKQMTEFYVQGNSGIGNNMMLAIDINKKMKHPDVWLSEEMPGLIRTTKLNQKFRMDGYVAVFNVPYHADIYKGMGYQSMKDKYGKQYDYEETPQHRLIKRLHGSVTDMDGMQELISHNDYKRDEESVCEFCEDKKALPSLAIAPRFDLIKNATRNRFKSMEFGAVDGKVTDLNALELGMHRIYNGPPTNNLELRVSNWEPFDTGVYHRTPFDWVEYKWKFLHWTQYLYQIRKRSLRRRKRTFRH